jgi:hypothetical protein
MRRDILFNALTALSCRKRCREGVLRILWLVAATAALLFWGYGAFDMWASLTGWPPYVAQYGEEMFAWIQGFPLWRKLAWGASIACGLAAAGLMFLRAKSSGDLMLAAVGLMVLGFSYDLVFEDGVDKYGRQGLIASCIVMAIASLFAWAAYTSTKPPPIVLTSS